jgi:hypothetical protein
MSKHFPTQANRWRFLKPQHSPQFLGLLLCLLAICLPANLPSSAQRAAQGNDATSASARNAALIAATNEVLKETSELRQLPVLRPVTSSAQSRTEIEKMIRANLDRETTPAQMHAGEVTLKRLGLAPPDFQLRPLVIRLLTEQVAGYYDPKAREFHLADWIDVDGQKPIMAHELTHALQDQHFDLRRFEHWPKGDSDAELAAHALIEGDATLVMTYYIARNPLRALAFMKSLGSTGVASEELDKAPRALRETLLFPYQEGMNWTRTLYRYGGWNKLSEAFKALPQSTEQILHPEKYFVHESPVKVTLPDISATLNARNSRKENWKRIDSDVNGEWGFYLQLDEFLKSPSESQAASAGWAGDAYAVYENNVGEVLYVSVSTWDREKDAQEFFDAYVKRTGLLYLNATSVEPSQSLPNISSSHTWRTSEGTVVLALRGTKVLILEGLPAGTKLGPIVSDALR